MVSPGMQALGEEAASTGLGISEFQERHRDTHDFARRVGQLPEQREGDRVDYRPLLHRDGSVLSGVTLAVRLLRFLPKWSVSRRCVSRRRVCGTNLSGLTCPQLGSISEGTEAQTQLTA